MPFNVMASYLLHHIFDNSLETTPDPELEQ